MQTCDQEVHMVKAFKHRCAQEGGGVGVNFSREKGHPLKISFGFLDFGICCVYQPWRLSGPRRQLKSSILSLKDPGPGSNPAWGRNTKHTNSRVPLFIIG